MTAGCHAAGAPTYRQSRLVLLYMSCTLNEDFLTPYNPEVVYTPSIAKLGSRSLVFRKHQTESGQSGIAFASVFTGSRASHHGVFKHPRKLLAETEMSGEVFRDGGYDTWAWLAHGMADAQLNDAQGVPKRQAIKEIRVFGRICGCLNEAKRSKAREMSVCS